MCVVLVRFRLRVVRFGVMCTDLGRCDGVRVCRCAVGSVPRLSFLLIFDPFQCVARPVRA